MRQIAHLNRYATFERKKSPKLRDRYKVGKSHRKFWIIASTFYYLVIFDSCAKYAKNISYAYYVRGMRLIINYYEDDDYEEAGGKKLIRAFEILAIAARWLCGKTENR